MLKTFRMSGSNLDRNLFNRKRTGVLYKKIYKLNVILVVNKRMLRLSNKRAFTVKKKNNSKELLLVIYVLNAVRCT